MHRQQRARQGQMDGRRWRTSAVLAVLFLLAVPAMPAAADGGQTFYVSPLGSDDGDCTSQEPCQTIQHAEDLAGAGDIVLVRPGVYDERVTVDTQDLTICGTAPDGTSCAGTPQGAVVDLTAEGTGFLMSLTAPGVTVQGLALVTGLGQSALDVRSDGAWITGNVLSSEVANEAGSLRTIGVNAVAADVTVTGNVFSGWVAQAVGVWRADATIEGNTFSGSRVAVHLAGLADGTEIRSNTFEGHVWSVRFAGQEAGDRQQAENVVLEDNLFGPASAAAIRLEANTDGLTVDATHNAWGVVTCQAIQERIDDQGDNDVLVAPYQIVPGEDATAIEDPTC